MRRKLSVEQLEDRRLLSISQDRYEPCEVETTQYIQSMPMLLLEATDTVAPRILDVKIRSQAWDSSFLQRVDVGGGLGFSMKSLLQQQNSLPWRNIDQILIQFDEDVGASFDISDVAIVGVQVPNYSGLISVEYDRIRFIASLKIASPFGVDKLQVVISDTVTDADGNRLDGEWVNNGSQQRSGDGNPGGIFSYRINVLPGDISGDGVVLGNDITLSVLARNKSVVNPDFNPLTDLDGSGTSTQQELEFVVSQRSKSLPTIEITSPVQKTPPLPNIFVKAAIQELPQVSIDQNPSSEDVIGPLIETDVESHNLEPQSEEAMPLQFQEFSQSTPTIEPANPFRSMQSVVQDLGKSVIEDEAEVTHDEPQSPDNLVWPTMKTDVESQDLDVPCDETLAVPTTDPIQRRSQKKFAAR